MISKLGFLVNYVLCYILYFLSALFCLKEMIGTGIIILAIGLVIHIVVNVLLIFFKIDIASENFHKNYFILQAVFLLFYLAALFSRNTDKTYTFIIILEGLFLLTSLFYELSRIKNLFSTTILKKNRTYLMCYLFVCILFFLFSISIIKVSYMWDTEIYVRNIVTNSENFNFTFSNILHMTRSHIQLGFDYIYSFFFYLFFNNGNLLFLGNIILGFITIWCFGEIARKFITQINPPLYFCTILLFASLPLFLGTLPTITLDYAMFCFYIWFVCAHMKQNKVFTFVTLLLLCLSKEPGVILGASYLAAFYLMDLIKVIKQSYKKKKVIDIIKSLPLYEYVSLIIPFIVFVLVFVFRGGSRWIPSDNGDEYIMNEFGFIGFDYFVQKFREVFLLNYSWVLWSMILVLLLYIVIKKKKIKLKYLIPIIISFFSYLIFNCFYITYIHPRYIVASSFIMSLLFIVCINVGFKNERYKKGIMLTVSGLLLLQCFYNSDAVSQKLYQALPVENGKLLSTRIFDKYLYSDANVYNRQFIYWQYALIDFLEEIDYKEDDLLIFPDIEYGLKDEMARYCILGLWKPETYIYYNNRTKSIENFETSKNIVINTQFYNIETDFSQIIKNYNRVYYVDIGILEDKTDTTQAFLEEYPVAGKKEYTKRSWRINTYEILKKS